MGKLIKDGIIVSFANQKGGVGKSTITTILAGHLHTAGKNEHGFKIAVVDADDTQSTLTRLRNQEGGSESDFKIINMLSKDVPARIDFLKKNYDIILIDLPGNIKQSGVLTLYHFIDIIIIPMQTSFPDVDSSILFYENTIKPIVEARKKQGFKTTVKGMFNRVKANQTDFKELYAQKDKFQIDIMERYLKDTVSTRRNLSTIEDNSPVNPNHEINLFCEEVIELITKHLQS